MWGLGTVALGAAGLADPPSLRGGYSTGLGALSTPDKEMGSKGFHADTSLLLTASGPLLSSSPGPGPSGELLGWMGWERHSVPPPWAERAGPKPAGVKGT